mmetsp:Transcript_84293/g.131614  ORF Transcript_84293/g.131614 Transcript_84293/m.131614 type:complete len:213 (-) Transcript_84293:36-674(-)
MRSTMVRSGCWSHHCTAALYTSSVNLIFPMRAELIQSSSSCAGCSSLMISASSFVLGLHLWRPKNGNCLSCAPNFLQALSEVISATAARIRPMSLPTKSDTSKLEFTSTCRLSPLVSVALQGKPIHACSQECQRGLSLRSTASSNCIRISIGESTDCKPEYLGNSASKTVAAKTLARELDTTLLARISCLRDIWTGLVEQDLVRVTTVELVV